MEIIRGDKAVIRLSVTDSDGVVFDLTDYEITFTAVGPKTITKTIGSGIEVPTPADGNAIITLGATDTETTGGYKYDVQLKKGDDIYTVIISDFTIINDITK